MEIYFIVFFPFILMICTILFFQVKKTEKDTTMETTPSDKISIWEYAIRKGLLFLLLFCGVLCIRLIGCPQELVIGRIVGVVGSGVVLYCLWMLLYVVFNGGISAWRKRGEITSSVANGGEKVFSSKLTWGVLAVVAILLLGAILGVMLVQQNNNQPKAVRTVGYR